MPHVFVFAAEWYSAVHADAETPIKNAPNADGEEHWNSPRRDIEIFKLLERYRYLRSSYLYSFAGGLSETRFKERLGDLFHGGFIARPERQWEFADARCLPAVHEIDTGAERVLQGCGDVERAPRTFLASNAHRQFSHSLMICECLASIELATLGNKGVRSFRGLKFSPAHPSTRGRLLFRSAFPYRRTRSFQTASLGSNTIRAAKGSIASSH